MFCAYGSSFGTTAIGVFLSVVMALARSLMCFVDISLSLATVAASRPVSFLTFVMWALISVRSF